MFYKPQKTAVLDRKMTEKNRSIKNPQNHFWAPALRPFGSEEVIQTKPNRPVEKRKWHDSEVLEIPISLFYLWDVHP